MGSLCVTIKQLLSLKPLILTNTVIEMRAVGGGSIASLSYVTALPRRLVVIAV